MKQRNLIVLLLFFVLLVACGCEQIDPNADSEPFYSSERFAILDTTRFILTKQLLPTTPTSEAFLNWELSFGEPYIDFNGNGVFDSGTDSLIDLNGNSIYDSPESTWTAGIPFDDINGDGICQQWPGLIHTEYQDQLPYADNNLNHVWDSAAAFSNIMTRLRVTNPGSAKLLYGYFVEDSVYHFQSNSGLHYFLPHNPILTDLPVGAYNLHLSDTALHYFGTGVQLEIFKRGEITSNVFERYAVLQTWWIDQVLMTRTIETDASLTVGDTVYHQLLHVRFDNGRRATPEPFDPTPSYFYDFYFAAGRGLIAISWRDRFTVGHYSYNNRYDSLPLPLVR